MTDMYHNMFWRITATEKVANAPAQRALSVIGRP